jgi:hypothetical protein
MEGLVTPSAEAIPGGVRIRLVEVQQVEHHLDPGEAPPVGWETLDDGLAARGPEHVLSAVFEVSLPLESITAFIQELVSALNTAMADDPAQAARIAADAQARGVTEAPNGMIVPKLELPPGIDLRPPRG